MQICVGSSCDVSSEENLAVQIYVGLSFGLFCVGMVLLACADL